MDTKQRFDECVSKGRDDDCWLWGRKPNSSGYGYIRVLGKKTLAHRLSYELHIGQIPDGMVVCHRCDTPLCVNPKHLFVGTHADNAADKVSKGRQTIGAKNGRAKLSADMVCAIRTLVTRFGIKHSAISSSLGVSRSTVSMAVNGSNWGHI